MGFLHAVAAVFTPGGAGGVSRMQELAHDSLSSWYGLVHHLLQDRLFHLL